MFIARYMQHLSTELLELAAQELCSISPQTLAGILRRCPENPYAEGLYAAERFISILLESPQTRACEAAMTNLALALNNNLAENRIALETKEDYLAALSKLKEMRKERQARAQTRRYCLPKTMRCG